MNTKKNIEVVIAAQVGTGKSSLAFLFKEFLKEKGIEYSVEGDSDFLTEGDMDNHFKKRGIENYVSSLKEKVKINLKQVQLNHTLNADLK